MFSTHMQYYIPHIPGEFWIAKHSNLLPSIMPHSNPILTITHTLTLFTHAPEYLAAIIFALFLLAQWYNPAGISSVAANHLMNYKQRQSFNCSAPPPQPVNAETFNTSTLLLSTKFPAFAHACTQSAHIRSILDQNDAAMLAKLKTLGIDIRD